MLETISDFLSIGVMVVIAIYGVFYLYDVSVKHRELTMRSIESRYYRYYEGLDDEDDDEDEPYYED